MRKRLGRKRRQTATEAASLIQSNAWTLADLAKQQYAIYVQQQFAMRTRMMEKYFQEDFLVVGEPPHSENCWCRSCMTRLLGPMFNGVGYWRAED